MKKPNINDYNSEDAWKDEMDYYTDSIKYIDHVESQKKDMIKSIEQLLLIIHPNLGIFTAKEVGKDRSYIWNKVVSQAQKLIKQGIS